MSTTDVCPVCGQGRVERSHAETGVGDMDTGELHGQRVRYGACDACGATFELDSTGAWQIVTDDG
jgi:ribosomal protein L37AE/L43A